MKLWGCFQGRDKWSSSQSETRDKNNFIKGHLWMTPWKMVTNFANSIFYCLQNITGGVQMVKYVYLSKHIYLHIRGAHINFELRWVSSFIGIANKNTYLLSFFFFLSIPVRDILPKWLFPKHSKCTQKCPWICGKCLWKWVGELRKNNLGVLGNTCIYHQMPNIHFHVNAKYLNHLNKLSEYLSYYHFS